MRKRKIRQVFNILLLLTDLPHTRRDSKSATSIGATAHWADRLFRLRKALTKFPPLAVVSAFPTAAVGSHL